METDTYKCLNRDTNTTLGILRCVTGYCIKKVSGDYTCTSILDASGLRAKEQSSHLCLDQNVYTQLNIVECYITLGIVKNISIVPNEYACQPLNATQNWHCIEKGTQLMMKYGDITPVSGSSGILSAIDPYCWKLSGASQYKCDKLDASQ